MAEPLRAALKAGAAVALLLCAGCLARPTGDFGRAQGSVLHDEVMPAAGTFKRAYFDEKPVSSFNRTDEERLMHDRIWRYLTAPHAKDWSFNTSVEFQRTRIGTTDHLFRPDRYYKLISGEAYASSHTRFDTMADSISIDIELLPPTFAAICAVYEIDRRRGIAANGAAGLEPRMVAEQAARRAENAETIGWFVRALRYRYESYDYALTHLLVETPHEQAVRVDGLQSQLMSWVDRAQAGDFCIAPMQMAQRPTEAPLAGRVLMGAQPDIPK